ncbi:MAG: hypothetical protein M3310_05300 [Actinomycetota bacterium]|nr:hypothetical protein [Actinomycetota bacterium]
MTEQYGTAAEARKRGKSRHGFKEAAREAAKDIMESETYRVELHVTTSGTGNPIHEYIVDLVREDLS